MSVIFESHANDIIDSTDKARKIALEIIGGKAETYAKQLCPVGTPESTGIPGYVGGTLRNSITHEQYDKNTEVVGTNVKYAPWVELGHHTVSGSFVAPKPYIRPAAENHSEEYRKVIEACLAQAVNS